jgi:hypothetical protein
MLPAAAADYYPRTQVTPIKEVGSNVVWVFITEDGSGAIWGKRSDGGQTFGGWQNIGNGTNHGYIIAAANDHQNRIVLFVRGNDNRIYYIRQSSAGSTMFANAWSVLNGQTFTTDPVVGVNKDGTLEVFAASGNTVYYTHESTPGSTFVAWSSLGNSDLSASGSDLSAAKSPSGRLIITAGYYFRAQTSPGGSWGSWTYIDYSAFTPHHVKIVDGGFAVGDNYYCSDQHCTIRAYQFNDSTGKFQAGISPGGSGVVSQDALAPIAVDPADDTIAVLGTDLGIWYQPCPLCSPSYWTNLGYTPFGPTSLERPTLLTVPSLNLQYVFLNDGPNVYERVRYTTSGQFLSGWNTI